MNRQAVRPAIEVALARAGVYRWFSKAFQEPTGLNSGTSLRQTLAELPGFDQAILPHVGLSGLASEYRRLFSHNLTPDCPPYETQHGSTHIFWQSQQLADIAGFYRAFGVELSQAAHERIDHLAVELEFMGYLALKEAYALERHHDAQVAVVQDAQRKFLNEHLGRWVSVFSSRVEAKLPGSAYASLAETLNEVVRWDCQRLGVQPEPLHFEATAQRQEPAEEGCLPAPCGTPGPCGGPGGPACA